MISTNFKNPYINGVRWSETKTGGSFNASHSLWMWPGCWSSASQEKMGDPHTAWLHFHGRQRFEENFALFDRQVDSLGRFLKPQKPPSWFGRPMRLCEEMRGLSSSNDAMVDELVEPWKSDDVQKWKEFVSFCGRAMGSRPFWTGFLLLIAKG